MCIQHIEVVYWWEKAIPLLVATLVGGSISALVSFKIFKLSNKNEVERIRERKSHDKENLRKELSVKWYFNVIILRNTVKIETFFDETKNLIENSIKLMMKHSKTESNEKLNFRKAEYISKFKSKLTQFEFDFLKLVQSNEYVDKENILGWQLKLNDYYRTLLDEIMTTEEDLNIEEISLEFSKFKTILYSELYKPLKEIHDKE